jgi:DNA-binding MarR family transcriptional regulator
MYVGMSPILPAGRVSVDRRARYPAEMPSDLEKQSSELLVYAARMVRAVRRRVGQPAGMRIMALIDELGPQGVTTLAEADRSSQPTVSGAVRQLEEQGLVAKTRDATDARRTVVTLTTEGRRQLVEARRNNGAAVAEQLARTGHTADEVATAVALLRDVLDEQL